MDNQQNDQPAKPPVQSSSKTKPQPSILPITPDREKMSRALGAAFLQHKVQQLERNLDDLSFRRDLHQPPPRTQHSHQTKSSHPNRNQSKKKTLLQPVSSTDPTPSSSDSSTPVPIKLIDTSMLIHALPILKKWVREAKYKIVIPLDVVSELDFLKTSPPPIHGLVREATCWLDKQFQTSSKQSSTDSAHKACFVPQRTGNESGWEELSQRFIAPPLEVASIAFIKELSEDEERERLREGEQEQDPPIDYRPLISTDLPREHRSLLQCALYYQLHAQSDQETELVIFFSDKQPSSTPTSRGNTQRHHQNSKPSSHWKSESIPSGEDDHEEEPVDKTVDLSHWAERFEIKTQKLHPSDLAQAKQWIRSYNEKLKQQQQQHHHPQRLCPSIYSHTATTTPNTTDRSTHSTTNRGKNSRQNPSPAPNPAAPSSSSSAAVDKRLFVW